MKDDVVAPLPQGHRHNLFCHTSHAQRRSLLTQYTSRPSDSSWIGRPGFTTHFACGDDELRWLTSGGWYHNGSETRRFSDTPPSQKIAFHGLKSAPFRRIEHHIGGFKWSEPLPGRCRFECQSFARAYDRSPVEFSCDGQGQN